MPVRKKCCFNSFWKASRAPPRALRLQSSSRPCGDKHFAMQFLPCFWWFCGSAVDCLHQVPGVCDSPPQYSLERGESGHTAYRDNFLGNLQFPLLPLWEVIRHAELIRLLPVRLFNLFRRHVAKHHGTEREVRTEKRQLPHKHRWA